MTDISIGNKEGLPQPREALDEKEFLAVLRQHIGRRRQQDLDHMFHVDPEFEAVDPQGAAELKERFLEDKRGLNLGECFALSLTEPYFGKVRVVKLASTDHTVPDSSQKLMLEVRDFREWFGTKGPLAGQAQSSINSQMSETMGDDEVKPSVESLIADGKDPGDMHDRLRSGRWMEYEYYNPGDGQPEHEVAIIERIRPFIQTNALVNGVMCHVVLYKETAFTLPAHILREMQMLSRKRVAIEQTIPAAVIDAHDPIDEHTMRAIERYLYTSDGDPFRKRLHTAIYSSVVPMGQGL